MAEETDNQEQDNRPAPPLPLDYQRPSTGPYQPRTPLGIQVVAGFAAWIVGIAFVIGIANNRTWGSPIDSQNATLCAVAFALIGIGTLTIWLRMRYRWRGFLPGLLIGLSLSCLLPIGIILVICGPHIRL